jgi:Putative peptidoglycan binding domain/S-layer homology domain/L,D-transpeptidase catalytic domain
MKHGLVFRASGRLLAIGVGVFIAVALFAGAQAQAATTTTTTTETATTARSLAIEPEAGYQDAILQMGLRSITNRAGDPYFAGADVATRGQMAVYLARALHLPDGQSLSFGDVGAAHWGYAQIGAVYDAGLMQGTSPTTFSPDSPVSRQEAMALVLAALRYSAQDQQSPVFESLTPYEAEGWLAGFQDRNLIDPQYSGSVAMAYSLGLFDAPAEGWLLPKLGLTHAELVGMLERAFAEPPTAKTSVPVAVDTVNAADAYPKLSKGSTGTLVLLLQQRLNALNYPCGEPDGKYSNHTRDAVYAFEKYERLKRTGYVDQGVWDALFAASAPVPVYQGDSGRRVEVDLTRQIMMLIEDNKVVMTIHVSTGKFGTPTGDWHVRTLSHGWRATSLGPIYSPSYFMAHNAIHGYPSVPTYPASHNCVRTPIWIQDEIVSQLEMGELVHVFYNKAAPTS